VDNLVNAKPMASDDPGAIDRFWQDIEAWCKRVREKLKDREVFTVGDQVHFDSLGLYQRIETTGSARGNEILSYLKIERLRYIERSLRSQIAP
jgi:hypothetical protein